MKRQRPLPPLADCARPLYVRLCVAHGSLSTHAVKREVLEKIAALVDAAEAETRRAEIAEMRGLLRCVQ